MIFYFLKKLLKKTKNWRRNRGFTLSPEVKSLPLEGQPVNRDDFRGIIVKNWLLSYSVDQPPSIFLGAILLGMNKRRPWKLPWTSSKKRKKRTKNVRSSYKYGSDNGFESLRLSYQSKIVSINIRISLLGLVYMEVGEVIRLGGVSRLSI